jgi:hypothetical protein
MPFHHLFVSLALNVTLLVVLTGLGLRLVGRIFSKEGVLSALVGSCVGISCFIAFIFSITALGILRWPVVLGFLLIAGLAGYSPLRSFMSDLLKIRRDDAGPEKLGYFGWTLLGLIGVALVANLLFAYAPPTGEDELHYHISLPALFAYWGKWVKTPAVFSSFFPLNGQMLYTGVFVLAGGYAVKALVWLTGGMLALAVYSFGRRCLSLGKTEALLSAALVYTCPMFTSYSGITSVAFINIFFEVVALMVAWKWKERPDHKLLIVLAVLAGVGMGFRMYAAPWVIAIALCILWPVGGIRPVFIYGAIASLLYSPWLIRNVLETGNPLYPWPLWKGAAFDPYQMGMLVKGHEGSLTSLLKLPLSTSVGGLIWGIGPLPWALAPFVMLQREFQKRFARFVLFIGVLIVILHLVPGVRSHPRYYDAALPWIAMLASAGFQALLIRMSLPLQRTLKVFVIAVLVIPNLFLSLYFGAKRVPLMIGRESEEEYLQKHYPGHEGFEMFQYLRTHFPATESVLRLGDPPNSSAYYFPNFKILPMSSFPPTFYQNKKPEDFARALRAAGVENILFPYFSYQQEKDGSWRFTEYENMDIVLPPLTGPSFEMRHQTKEAVLYRIKT